MLLTQMDVSSAPGSACACGVFPVKMWIRVLEESLVPPVIWPGLSLSSVVPGPGNVDHTINRYSVYASTSHVLLAAFGNLRPPKSSSIENERRFFITRA